MHRRNFVKASLAAAVAAAMPLGMTTARSAFAQPPTEGEVSLIKPIRFDFASAGRIGFYVDYSELSDTGDHVFYVSRTHGTSGAVSVSYSTHGDDHQARRGTISWGDGEADIKSFRVQVAEKTAGEHRIYAQLSNAAGGAVLQFGEQTRAFGVIDDGTVSSDAVFFDADLAQNGSGTQASPYNNIYDALEKVGTKRFIYGKGTFSPDGTHKVGPYSHKGKGIATGNPRIREEDRLIIRAWPGSTLVIDGQGDLDTFGFFCGDDESYHTYKNIVFRNLSTVGTRGAPCAAIWYHYGNDGSKGITVEGCDISAIDGRENQGGISPYGVDGFKVWRCDVRGVAKLGDTSIAAGILTYDGRAISVQRSNFSDVGKGTYQKRVGNAGDVSICCRFNVFNRTSCYYGRSGDTNSGHSHTIVQANIFTGDNGGDLADSLVHKTENPAMPGKNFWWCNNIFDGCGEGANGAIILKLAKGANIFNNIFTGCRWSWTEYYDGSSVGADIGLADYNHHHDIGFKHFMWRGDDYRADGSLEQASGHARNDVFDVAPGFVDASVRDYRLASGSPCIGTGYGGIDKGVFITKDEVIGPEDTLVKSKILLRGKLNVEVI